MLLRLLSFSNYAEVDIIFMIERCKFCNSKRLLETVKYYECQSCGCLNERFWYEQND
jgi:hypothetical protein